jgi:TRAP-type uncharacterized transport system fused permease subunit
MATMTPPVATTAFVAASIANVPPMKVGFLSMRIALVAYLMPFIFIYQPALILDGSFFSIIIALLSALFAAALLAIGSEGWYTHDLKPISRILIFISGLFALTGHFLMILISILLISATLGIERYIYKPVFNKIL